MTYHILAASAYVLGVIAAHYHVPMEAAALAACASAIAAAVSK